MEMNKKEDKIPQIYIKYVKEICKIDDISRWSSRKTITESVLNPSRTNEQKVQDALLGNEYSIGDKRTFYFRNDNSLSLSENWDSEQPNHSIDKLLEKLWKTLQIFKPVYDTSKCMNFKLKRNKSLLAAIKT